jgi:hypothetical protein
LDYGKAFVRHLELLVKASAINEWFGTKYLTPDLPKGKSAKSAAKPDPKSKKK